MTAPAVNVPEVFTLVIAVEPVTVTPSAPNWMVFAAVVTAWNPIAAELVYDDDEYPPMATALAAWFVWPAAKPMATDFAPCEVCPALDPMATAPIPWLVLPDAIPNATALAPCEVWPAPPPTETAPTAWLVDPDDIPIATDLNPCDVWPAASPIATPDPAKPNANWIPAIVVWPVPPLIKAIVPVIFDALTEVDIVFQLGRPLVSCKYCPSVPAVNKPVVLLAVW